MFEKAAKGAPYTVTPTAPYEEALNMAHATGQTPFRPQRNV